MCFMIRFIRHLFVIFILMVVMLSVYEVKTDKLLYDCAGFRHYLYN